MLKYLTLSRVSPLALTAFLKGSYMGHFCQLYQLVFFDKHRTSYLHLYTDKSY